MERHEDYFSQNEKELMEYFGYSGSFGLLKLRLKFLRTWLLHKTAYSSANSSWVVKIELLCVIGTPFGLVVVPEVYIK